MTMIPPSIRPAHAGERTLGELLGIPSSAAGSDDAHSSPEGVPLPLLGVTARVAIVGDCALTELTERYANPHDMPLDVEHTIPLPAGAAVIGMELRAADRAVHGRCLRTADARRAFGEARARGKTAAMTVQVRRDMQRISLGNVPPRAEVTVKLRLVERLRADAGRFEYRLPTAISPKFVPGTPTGHDGDGWSPDTDRAPDASRLTPPILLAGRIPLDLEVTLAPGATDIQSSLALDRTDQAGGPTLLRPAAGAACDGDVVIRFWAREGAPTLRAYTDGTATLVVIDPPADRIPELERPREAIYVLDRSGSMDGSRIEAAKRAVAASIRRLGPQDRLQVIAFNHDFRRSTPLTAEARPDMVADALEWLGEIEAMGGTNAQPALQAACTEPMQSGFVRTVLFVTDGDIGADEELLELATCIDPATRVFAVGIGRGPSMALVARLARLGGGSHLAIESDDHVEQEIQRFDACMLGPIACGVHEACNDASARTDLFAGRAATFMVEGARTRIRVESVDGRFAGECDVLPSPMPLGALWACTEVDRLEDLRIQGRVPSAGIDERIAALGVAHGIQTRLTSFVAVDEASQVSGEGLEVVQPVPVPADLCARSQLRLSMGSRGGHSFRNIDDSSDEVVHESHAPARAPRWMVPGMPVDWFGGEGIGVAELREGLAMLERTQLVVSQGADDSMDPEDALAVLVMLEACRPSRLGGRRLPRELRGHDLSRRGRLWKSCRRRIEALREHPAWPLLERALRGTGLARMREAAALVVG